MALEGGLDLLGVDLLPAAVDGLRAATQHRDAAVGFHLGVVARNRVAHTVVGAEGFGCLLLVLVVADGNVALLSDDAPNTRTRIGPATVFLEHDGCLVDRDSLPARLRLPFGHDAGPAEARFRGSDRV